jgi:hypothetical protein
MPQPTRLAVILGATLSALLPPAASAVPVLGNLQFSGALGFADASFDFQPPPAGGNGTVLLSLVGQTGDFAPLAGTAGVALDLSGATSPVNTLVSISSWLTFAANPDLQFTLLRVLPGNFSSAACFSPPAAGQNCTPFLPAPSLLPALNLTNTTAASSTAGFALRADAIRVSTGETTPALCTFSAPLAMSYQSFLATVFAGGTVTASFAAACLVDPTAPVALQSFSLD